MKMENGKIEGDFTIDEDFELKGMITGNVKIINNSSAIIHGQISGDLIVNQGTSVLLHGQVLRNASNNGGLLEVYGMISGQLFDNAGETKIHPGASINGENI